MDEVGTFCRLVRSRSEENSKAMGLLQGSGLYGPMVGILRQEIDSLVRVQYLLSIRDKQRRRQLITDLLSGNKWRHPNGGRITDREMVDQARRSHHWVNDIYNFGCSFIHLSHLHDYMARDPVTALSPKDRGTLFSYLRQYHGGTSIQDPGIQDLVAYLPLVFRKVADNLGSYLKGLEIQT